MNETLKVIKERFSCRSFTRDLLDNREIEAIVNAAIQSPSSMNRQRWQVIAIKNQDLIAEIESEGMEQISKLPDQSVYDRIQGRGGHLFYQAPHLFIIAIEPTDLPGASLDCGIVAQTVALAAQSLGAASCICSLTSFAFAGNKKDYFKEKLLFPTGYEFGISILIGKPVKQGSPHTPNPEKVTIID